MKRQIKIYFLICLTFFLSFNALSQLGTPPTGPGDPACWPPPCIPVDGGIGFLIIIGAALGIKKIYFTKK